MKEATARPRYYTPAEVAAHNPESDLWVSFLGGVYDLTSLAKEHEGDPLLRPLLTVAGKDISHWFDSATGEVKTHVDPVTGCTVAFTPRGRFIHVPPPCPRTDWAVNDGLPWWRDKKRCVGVLTARTRPVRVLNMLSGEAQLLEVCTEETINEIQDRYRKYNTHTDSYTWKFAGKKLAMDQTLQANGIPDDSEELYGLSMDSLDAVNVPEIHVYFNDDLTAH
eukprot:m.28331 g.28331  ORF g.28331 m.28331 type:complete len:222 (+) comp10256_c0_seq1:136-801(+)